MSETPAPTAENEALEPTGTMLQPEPLPPCASPACSCPADSCSPLAAAVERMKRRPPVDGDREAVERDARLYATAEEARRAVDDAAYTDGGQPDPHTYLGGISDEAECYCGIQMPLNEDGSPRLTFEEWIEYHDEVQMRTLETDAALYAESDEHPDNQPLRTRPIPPVERER